MTFLLDGNVLVALTTPEHVHHEAAHRWLGRQRSPRLATCPITQGTLLRVTLRAGGSVHQALNVLAGLAASPTHEFWPDHLTFLDVPLDGVVGHRQVTDAYLADLARAHQATLATFDRGLSLLHPDTVELVPTG